MSFLQNLSFADIVLLLIAIEICFVGEKTINYLHRILEMVSKTDGEKEREKFETEHPEGM